MFIYQTFPEVVLGLRNRERNKMKPYHRLSGRLVVCVLNVGRGRTVVGCGVRPGSPVSSHSSPKSVLCVPCQDMAPPPSGPGQAAGSHPAVSPCPTFLPPLSPLSPARSLLAPPWMASPFPSSCRSFQPVSVQPRPRWHSP